MRELKIIFTEQPRRDDTSDRTGIRRNGEVSPDVGMSAEFAEDRAGVEARAAADTVERLFERRVAEFAASVIEQNDVTGLPRHRFVNQLSVDREFLPGGRAGK